MKQAQIIIVGAVTYVTFMILGLQYAALLATLVGLSVLVPYVGAAVVTIPIALVAYFQFGWVWEFGYVMIAYAIIQALDGNVLVPSQTLERTRVISFDEQDILAAAREEEFLREELADTMSRLVLRQLSITGT